jgi:hypothetical protein
MKEQLIEARRVTPIVEHKPFVSRHTVDRAVFAKIDQATLIAIRAELNKPVYNTVINIQNEAIPEEKSESTKAPESFDEGIVHFLEAIFSLGKGLFKACVHGAAAAYRHT